MDLHIKKLETICRLCGNFLKRERGYVNPNSKIDYKDIVINQFSISVEENSEVYPQLLCNTCKKKVR